MRILFTISFLLLLAACTGPGASSSAASAGGAGGERASLTANHQIYERLGELPGRFTGTFSWSDGHGDQQLEVWFEQVRAIPSEGIWKIRGRGVYRSPRETHIDVRVEIDPETRRFEMWESNPDNGGFVTEGSHIGKISKDLGAIMATWNGDDGRLGRLVLRAWE